MLLTTGHFAILSLVVSILVIIRVVSVDIAPHDPVENSVSIRRDIFSTDIFDLISEKQPNQVHKGLLIRLKKIMYISRLPDLDAFGVVTLWPLNLGDHLSMSSFVMSP